MKTLVSIPIIMWSNKQPGWFCHPGLFIKIFSVNLSVVAMKVEM